MADQYFHLTIGPVQAFVAQARRTRDFWAGSFILSYLSSVAMAAVRQQQGEIEFPVPDENFLAWLETGEGEELPKQGSVPNRFKAMEVKVQEGFDAGAVVNAVHTAWRNMAELVWEKDIAPVVQANSPQREIWERQINHFWEISWCLSADKNASNLLDRRKNWRTHVLADEPGVKCSLMEGYQELSGALKPGKQNREVQGFWDAVRGQKIEIARDIREDEHLCAIAFVKRRFVHHFEQLKVELSAVGRNPAKTLHGWKLPTSVPSIAYLAAAPWLAATIKASAENEKVQEAISSLERGLRLLDTPWEGRVLEHIQQVCNQVGYKGGQWKQVDGQYLYPQTVLQDIKAANQQGSPTKDDAPILEAVGKHLTIIRRETGLGEPSPFYAILLMDGDSLGVQMSDAAKQQGISNGLNNFTAGVPNIVEQHSGFLVYAGGDDVLAILPQPFALACAVAIQQHYDACFEDENKKLDAKHQITTSISGAINFAHYKTPLTRILQDSHALLDNVAKDATGRNSLAIRLWKPGGLNAEWAAPWPYVRALQVISQQVAEHLQGDLARGFFFKLETVINDLGLTDATHGFDETAIKALVRSAWAHTGNKLENLPANMDTQLFEACRVVKRVQKNNQMVVEATDAFAPGGLRVIQFLATENQTFLRATTESEGETA